MEKAVENEIDLSYERMYFMNIAYLSKLKIKLILLGIIGFFIYNVVTSEMVWWGKALIILVALFGVITSYYDLKYLLGIKKHPFRLSPEKNIFSYYNEFEGNKDITISDITEIKTYKRKKDEIFLLEIQLQDKKKEENVNVSGFESETIMEMLDDMKMMNPNLVISSNRDEKEKKEKSKKEKRRKKEKAEN